MIEIQGSRFDNDKIIIMKYYQHYMMVIITSTVLWYITVNGMSIVAA